LALPGVSVQIQDRFFALSRTDVPVGPRVCAIAKRSTADATGGVRDLDAYEATSESDVIDAFGENSNLHKAFVELISGGAQRIILVALPSDSVFNHTTATFTSSAYELLTCSHTRRQFDQLLKNNGFYQTNTLQSLIQ
jgi:hypothetical protein